MFSPTADSPTDRSTDLVLDRLDPATVHALRRTLIRLASAQEEAAAAEAANIPYWEPYPLHALGLRSAATTLRAAADALPTEMARFSA